jgi:hypothetical protein
MTRKRGNSTADDYLYEGSPAGLIASSMPRRNARDDLAALTTQVMLSVALPLQAGDVVTSLTFVSGDTAADTPLNWWFALYDTAGAKMAQSADQTTGAWAANTAKTLALATAQLAQRAGIYYAAIMVKATATPTLVGVSLQNAVVAGALGLSAKVLAQTSGSALTATAPSTIATPTTVKTVPLVIAS